MSIVGDHLTEDNDGMHGTDEYLESLRQKWLESEAANSVKRTELHQLRVRKAYLEAMLQCIHDNLNKGMSKSMQRLQAREIWKELHP